MKRSNNGSTKTQNHWSLGLLDSMNNPDCIVQETKDVVVIKDKYPKAKLHYLVIPKDDIKSIFKLTKNHLDLLEQFNDIFNKVKKDHNLKLQAGFHAIPSMQRMHMHIISSDMVSDCLKTKTHWNSFTTKFFISLDEFISDLKNKNRIEKISNENHKKLLSTPLKCNQCDYVPKNMPELKKHLLSHCIEE